MSPANLCLGEESLQWSGWWAPEPGDAPWAVVRVADSVLGPGWVVLEQPLAIFETLPDAMKALDAGESFLFGILSYEAAPDFEAAAKVLMGPQPKVWFAAFALPLPFYKWLPDASGVFPEMASEWNREQYGMAFRAVQSHLAKGDSYQVNLTFRLRAECPDAAAIWGGFCAACSADPPDFAAFLRTETQDIACLSPELFFSRRGSLVTCKPMKGTSRRGADATEDQALASDLQERPKERAENLMIVDMIRNDLGRVANPGSVSVPRMFEVERLRSQLQMTSTVSARTNQATSAVLGALFPCASVVGAPKIETQRVIAELETSPRGLYTGCLGWSVPGGDAQFSVAIRTAVRNVQSGHLEYGVGGGVVWDSDEEAEWQECLLKGRLLKDPGEPWELLETLLWQDGVFRLIEEHLDRMAASAATFGLPWDDNLAREALSLAAGNQQQPLRVRLLMDRRGLFRTETSALPKTARPLTARLASRPVRSSDPSLLHKTTRRALYDQHRWEHPDVDEVVLWNERGEVTEFLIGNVAIDLDGRWWTPPVRAGLLPGVERDRLLQEGVLAERAIAVDEAISATGLARVNSVTGWCEVQLKAR